MRKDRIEGSRSVFFNFSIMPVNEFTKESYEEDISSLSVDQPIISYGSDLTLDSLYNFVESGQIKINPSFQRKFIWTQERASKLIESFLLGYPIPNVFFGRETTSEELEVIDGQQRIQSVVDYINGSFKDSGSFRLIGDDLDERYKDKEFSNLDEQSQRRFRNATLKAITFVYHKNHPNLKFTVFQRINTGSVKLSAQEIRNSVFSGPFNNFLLNLNKFLGWRSLVYKEEDKRMRDVELILRFFTAYFNHNQYKRPMDGFLNNFMQEHKGDSGEDMKKYEDLFETTAGLIKAGITSNKKPFHPKNRLNRAIAESIMYAIASLHNDKRLNLKSMDKNYKKLLENPDYLNAVESATSSEQSYHYRLNAAYDQFSQK
jgi:hypothetical protein